MSAGQVLRAKYAKERMQVSFARLADLLEDTLSLRAFVGYSLLERTPKASTLQENCSRVRAETLGQILGALVRSEEALGQETGEKVRVDCTVTETHVHEPSDSSLLWDCARVLTRLMKRGETLGVLFEDHSKAAKRAHRKIYYARRQAQRLPVYRDLIQIADRIRVEAERFARALRREEVEKREAERIADEIDRVGGLLARVLDQTRRRILEGEKVPIAEKVLSIFEPHTDLIQVGQRRPKFGHKLTFTVGASGLVLDCVVERGNPGDVTLTTRQLKRQKLLYGVAPRQAAFDGSFASRDNLEAARGLGVDRCMFSKAQGLTKTEMAGSRRTFGRLRNFRAGVEAWISYLKRCFGLRRCLRRGWEGFQAHVWSSVFAANLTTLARLRLRSV